MLAAAHAIVRCDVTFNPVCRADSAGPQFGMTRATLQVTEPSSLFLSAQSVAWRCFRALTDRNRVPAKPGRIHRIAYRCAPPAGGSVTGLVHSVSIVAKERIRYGE